MANPFPQLVVQPNSGLAYIPWAECNDGGHSTSSISLGQDGAGAGMAIYIPWHFLSDFVKIALGYSYTGTARAPNGTYFLKRNIPWRHPTIDNLWLQKITAVEGLSSIGKTTGVFGPFTAWGTKLDKITGSDQTRKQGSEFLIAKVHCQFWRPPYAVRTDAAILDSNGNPQEWLRYVDKNWSINTQMLTREASTFVWAPVDGRNIGPGFQGQVGQKITKLRVKRRWYEVPEAGIFTQNAGDITPNGLPTNLLYISTANVNPITGYFSKVGTPDRQTPIGGCVNLPVGTGWIQGTSMNCTTASGNPTIAVADSSIFVVGDSVVGTPIKPNTAITTIVDATHVTLSQNCTATGAYQLSFITDRFANKRFFGCPMGTLLLEGIEIVTRPLQMPAALMQILLAQGEPISQVQYDVVFEFEFFDPPRPPSEQVHWNRGHNLFPQSGNGLWYVARSRQDTASPPGVTAVYPNSFQTPFQYADFSDLFRMVG